jgi:uridine monophosphate synthetase
MSFFERLNATIETNHSLLCVGLDPQEAQLPPGDDIETRLITWAENIIRQTADLVCCYKPNIAFFEQFGPAGLRALQQIVDFIQLHDILVLLDAKRGDIGSTAHAYANAVYQQWDADAVTLNAYLGEDSIHPFLQPGKAVFLLCQTSNPSAAELQLHGDPPLYQHLARQAALWGTPEQIGFVVGATQPQALAVMRDLCPEHWFLAPGVGAQGGDLTEALQAGLRADGKGLIIPVSRAVLNADDPRQAARQLRDDIQQARASIQPRKLPSTKEQLIEALFHAGCVKFGQFTLASGKQSPIYVDLRRVVSFPGLLQQAYEAYRSALQSLSFDLIAGVPLGALPTSAILAHQMKLPLIYPRKEAKQHGTAQQIEGAYQSGQTAVMIEDVITSGGSILNAAEQLRAAGLVINDAVVLIDRQQGGREALSAHGLNFHAVLTIHEILHSLLAQSLIDSDTFTTVNAYLNE